MSNSQAIIQACAALLIQVEQNGAKEAQAEIEFGEGVYGFTFTITCRRTAGPLKDSPPRTKAKKAKKAPKPTGPKYGNRRICPVGGW